MTAPGNWSRVTSAVDLRLSDGMRANNAEALINADAVVDGAAAAAVVDAAEEEEGEEEANACMAAPSAIRCRNLATVAFCKPINSMPSA